MKPKKQEVTAAVEHLMLLTDQYQRGQTIPWGEIEKISGSRDLNTARHIINKWRSKMEKERVLVTFVNVAVGVWLLTHEEIVEHVPQVRQKKARRQVNRGIKQLSLADLTRIPLHKRKLVNAQIENMKQQRLAIGRSYRQLQESQSITTTTPRRKPAMA